MGGGGRDVGGWSVGVWGRCVLAISRVHPGSIRVHLRFIQGSSKVSWDDFKVIGIVVRMNIEEQL